MEITANMARNAHRVNITCAISSHCGLILSVSQDGKSLLLVQDDYLSLVYGDQTYTGNYLLSFIGCQIFEKLLYSFTLLTDLALGSHYERSAQEIIST